MRSILPWLLASSTTLACSEAVPSTRAPEPRPSVEALQFQIDVDPASGTTKLSVIGTARSGVHEARTIFQDGTPGNPAQGTWELETTSARLPGQGGCPAGRNCFLVTARNAEAATSLETVIRIDSISPSTGRALIGSDGAPAGSGLTDVLGIRNLGDVASGATVASIPFDISIPDLTAYTVRGSLWRRAALSSNPTAYWRFDGDGIDSSGNGHDGVQVGGGFAAGQVGQAFQSNGSGERFDIPASPAFDVAAFTIGAWIRPTFFSGAQGIFAKGTRGGPVQDWGFYSFGSEIAIDCNFPSAEQFISSSGAAIVTGVFQHVAAVVNPAGNELSFYKNGVLVNTVMFSTPLLINPSGLVTSTDAGAPNDYFGDLDELVFYNRALTAQEVADLAANGP